MKLLFFLSLAIILGSSEYSQCQNLVNNPSFEEYDMCPTQKTSHTFNGYVRNWHHVGRLGGRYSHLDCNPMSTYIENIAVDSMLPYEGEGIVILIANYKLKNVTKNIDSLSYYTSRLSSPLMADSIYKVSYYIHSNKHYSIADHYGCIFLKDTINLEYTIIGDTFEMVLRNDFIGFRDTFYGPDALYHKIEGCYQAKGGEEFIVFGSFLPPDEVHWFEPHVGYIQNVAYIVNLDNVSVVKTSQIAENNHTLEVCDGETIVLPAAAHPGTMILDSTGKEVSHIKVDWPKNETFYYEDLCFGTVGNIKVNAEICIQEIDTTIIICENATYSFSQFVKQGYRVLNENGDTILEFSSVSTGTFEFQMIHHKYGLFGTINLRVVQCDKCELSVPNVINPYSNNGNEFWGVTSECDFELFEAQIFDRWGNKVFATNEKNTFWDGKFRGLNCLPGVYMFSLKYKFVNPLAEQQIGFRFGDITIF